MTKYTNLQKTARDIGCKLTKTRPSWHTVKAPYYIHLPDGRRVIPAFDLKEVERLLKGEQKIQANGRKK